MAGLIEELGSCTFDIYSAMISHLMETLENSTVHSWEHQSEKDK